MLSNLEVSRDGVESGLQRQRSVSPQFEQQMEVVKATEAMQRAQQVTTSTVGIFQRFDSGRILKTPANASGRTSASPGCCRTVGKVADGRDLDEKLAEAGIGGSNKSSARDVLARLQRQQGE